MFVTIKLPEDEGAMKSKSGPGWKHRMTIGIKRWLGMNIVLCDNCKWNWRGACRNPDRPNATWCPEYEKRG